MLLTTCDNATSPSPPPLAEEDGRGGITTIIPDERRLIAALDRFLLFVETTIATSFSFSFSDAVVVVVVGSAAVESIVIDEGDFIVWL